MEGMIAIAVPVSDPSGRFFAALAYHGPTQRVSLGGAVKDAAMLKSAAERLTSAIFV